MELELGLKITRTRDDVTSTADLRITKDSSGPLFFSRETDTMFLLIVHLKGFRRENIDIQINKGGNEIGISGKKPVQEMVLMGWIMCKKEVELRAFKKVFRIPGGVILDKIKAKFSEEESTLKITMPKLVKGICGVDIEEVKEEEVDRGRAERESTGEIIKEESKEPETKKMEDVDQVVEKEVIRRYPEMTQVVADKVLEKGYHKEETVEPKTDKKEEIDQVVEEKDDRGESKATDTATDEVHERVGVTLDKEAKVPDVKKIEEVDKKKEIDRVMEEKVDKGESKVIETVAGEGHERVGEALKKEAKEPEVKKIEETDKKKETDRVGEEKIDRGESKATETVADEVHERIGEALEKEAKEPDVKMIEETDKKKETGRVVEEKVDKGESKATKGVADEVHEIVGEALDKEAKEPEVKKIEETDKKKEIDRVVEEKDDGRESKATKTTADDVHERVGETFEKEAKELDVKKIEEIDKKKKTNRVVEDKVDRGESKATETAADEMHERVGRTLEKEAKKPEVEKIEETDQVVKKSQAISEIEHSRELEKAAEPPATTKPKEVEANREVDQAHKKELLPTEGTSSIESAKTVVDELTQQSEVPKKPVQKKSSKLRAPLAIAGSAILVSLIVIVFHFIRPKKT